MATVRIRIEPALLGRLENRFAAGMRKRRIGKALQRAGRKIRFWLRGASKQVKDLGMYQRGWYAHYKPIVLTIGNDAPHMIFVEKGRRAGAAQPPIKPIREWALRHGMQAGAAFPLARKIARDGIKARPLFTLDTTQDKMADMVGKELSSYLDKVIIEAAK